MEERKWEDLNPDCLANIFGRLKMQSRVLVIPLVCKPWNQAVRNPLCWEHLIFTLFVSGQRSQTELIKFVVDQSQRCARSLVLPQMCFADELIYVNKECPDLKFLELSSYVCVEHRDIIPSLIVKWKNIETLSLGHMVFIKEILKLIRVHLPNLTALYLQNGDVDDETASTIVSLFPNLKQLVINQAILKKENLLLILQGCKELEYLDVGNCNGFDENDAEILKLSSGIKIFRSDGSRATEDLNFPDPEFLALYIENMRFDDFMTESFPGLYIH